MRLASPRNSLDDELRVDLSVLHLKDIELNLLAGELFKLTANAIGFGSTTSNYNARAGSVDVNSDTVTCAFDVHLGDASALKALGHHLSDLHIFEHVVAVALARV